LNMRPLAVLPGGGEAEDIPATGTHGPRWRGLRLISQQNAPAAPAENEKLEPPERVEASLFLLFLLARMLRVGDDLLRDGLRNNIIMIHFHVEGSASLSHGREALAVGKHFRHRHLRMHHA